MPINVAKGAGKEMRAMAIDRFRGPEVFLVRSVPVPEVGPEQVLIRVDSSGVGVWDVSERQGMIAKAYGIIEPKFL